MADASVGVLFLCGKVRLSSSCLFMLNLAGGLSEAGCRVRLVCSGLGAEGEALAAGVTIEEWSELKRPWSLLMSGGAMRSLLRDWRIDLVHVQGQRLGMFGRRLLSGAGVPLVFTPHPFDFSVKEVARIQGRARRVIAMNHGLRQDCVNKVRIPKEKITLVRQGIGPDAAPGSPPQVGEHAPVVGTVAPSNVGQGQDVLLRCARSLIDTGVNAQFLIAGDGPREGALRRLCRELALEESVTIVTLPRPGHFADSKSNTSSLRSSRSTRMSSR